MVNKSTGVGGAEHTACSRNEIYIQNVCPENLIGSNHLGHPSMDKKIIQKWTRFYFGSIQ